MNECYVLRNDVQTAFLPCATSDIQDMFDVVFSQEITKELSVRLRSFLVSANVVLPNSRCFAIGILIGNTRNTNSKRTRTVNTVNHVEFTKSEIPGYETYLVHCRSIN